MPFIGYTGHASDPLSGISDRDTFTYDASSRMLTVVNGQYGNTVTYNYDTTGRKSTKALKTKIA